MIGIILSAHLFFTETHLFHTTTWKLHDYITPMLQMKKLKHRKKLRIFPWSPALSVVQPKMT